MSYSIKDVDAAEKIIRAERPDLVISRGDYDWSLSVASKPQGHGVILFQPEREENGQREISSTLEEVKNICFLLGDQWTAEQIEKITSNRKEATNPIIY